MAHDDQACSDELCICWNHTLGCTAQCDDSQEYTYVGSGRSQGPEPRPERLFALRREPQSSVATHYLNGMKIGAALFGDTQGVPDRMFRLVRTVDGYDDE
jgi:hypothetical protein